MIHLVCVFMASQRSAVLARSMLSISSFSSSSWTTSRKNAASGERRLTGKVTRGLGKFGYVNSLNCQNGLETNAREYLRIRSDGTGCSLAIVDFRGVCFPCRKLA